MASRNGFWIRRKETKTSGPVEKPRKRRRPLGFMPLEPRIMYDGAGAATAAHHHHHEPTGASPDAAQAGPPPGGAGAVTPSGGDGHWHPNAAAAEPMPTVTTWVKNPTEIVFIDTRAPDYQLLAAGVKPGIEVVELNPNSDGVQQIADFLGRHPDPNLTTIDIVAHGSDGMLFLGNAVLDNATVGQYTAQLQTIGNALRPGGDLMLYGCDVAADPDGVILLAQITDATGVNVAASVGPVGSAAEGGTWTLNATSGPIDATVPFTAATLTAYSGLLDVDLFGSLASGLADGVLYAKDINGNNPGAGTGATAAYSGNGTLNSALETNAVVEGIQLDTAAGLYFVLMEGTQAGPSAILEGSLSAVLNHPTQQPAFTTVFSDAATFVNTSDNNAVQYADQVNAFQVDVADNVIFINDVINGNNFNSGAPHTDKMEVLTFSGANFSGAETTKLIGSVTNQALLGMVVDPLNHAAYFYETASTSYDVGPNGRTTQQGNHTKPVLNSTGSPIGNATNSSHEHVVTALTQDALFKATWNSNTNPSGSFTAFGQLPLAPADGSLGNNNFPTNLGEIEGLALDGSMLYFDTGAVNSGSGPGAAGIYSYALSGNSSGAYGTVVTFNNPPGAATGAFVIDPATDKYYVGLENGTFGAIYDGSLASNPSTQPVQFVNTSSTFNVSGDYPIATGITVDNAPVATASTHATPTADQNGAAVIVDSGITVTDSDNTELSTLSSPAAATVQITGNFQTGDKLTIGGATSGTLGAISYAFSGSTLTLTGTDTVADFQTALRDVQFETSSGASASPRTITFTADDGVLSGTATDQVNVVLPPTISSAAYDASTGHLTVTGSGFTTSTGDYSVTALTLKGEGGNSYTLTGGSIEANPTSTSFVVDLSAADQLAVDGLLNKNGTSSVGATSYNLAATASFDTGGNADTTAAVTVSNALVPTISSVSFNYATGVLTLGGTGFENEGGAGGLRLGDFTLRGQGGASYTLTSPNAAVSSETSATITLTGSDLTHVEALFDQNGTSSSGGTVYNLAATTGWDSDAGAAITTEGITVSAHGPQIATGVAQPSFVGGGAAVTLDSGLTVSDSGSANLVGATVTVTSGLQSGDILGFNNGSNTETFADNSTITASLSGGVLSLTGTASVGDYQTALDQVQFSFAPTNGDPTAGGGDTSRGISFVANDGTAASLPASLTLSVVHAAPSVTAGGNAGVIQGGSATTLDSGLVLSDPDSSGNLSSATVAVAGGVFGSDGDTLAAVTAGTSITASYNSATETLSLSGVDTIADYQTVLRSVTFGSSGPATGSRTIDWSVSDGSTSNGSSAVATSTVSIHTYPVVTAGATATFTGGGGPVALDPGLTVTDTSSTTLAGATVQIGTGFTSGDTLNFTSQNGITGSYNSSSGELTLSGSASVGNYQTALDSITYSFSPSNADPTGGGANTSRAISWAVTDGTLSSTAVNSTLDTVHAAPTVTAGATATFTGGGNAVALDNNLAVSDPDSGGNLTGATVSIGTNFTSGDTLNFVNQGGITGSYDSNTGVLTLSGTASVNNYQSALETITYSFTPSFGDPTGGGSATSRTIDFQVTDGVASSSVATSTVDVVHVAPTLNTGGTVTFIQGQPAVAADSTVSLSDPDSQGLLTGATVKITSGLLTGDMLSAVTTGLPSITTSYDSATGVLTLSGADTLADYRAVLGSVTFNSTSADPTSNGTDPSRTLTWKINDGVSTATGTSTIDVHAVPVVTAGATATFTGGGSAVALDPGLTVTDTSSSTLSSATVSIGTGFITGDTLNVANPNGLTVSYETATGVLTLSGTASKGTYQAALDSVTYGFTPANGDPTGGGADTVRTISFVVNDGLAGSTATTSTLDTVHVAPTVTAGATVTFTGGGPAVALDSGLTVGDVDSGGNLAGATVSIGTGFLSGDQLNFTAQNGISGSYNAATGVLTLSGTSSVANYQAALASITFSDGNNDPTGGGSDTSRTISFVVNDGVANSAAVTSTVQTVHVAPTVTAGATATFDGGGAAVALDNTLSVSDSNSGGNLTGAAVQIVGYQSGDTLNFTNTAHITGSYSNGVLTLSGTDTVADYQAALRSVSYSFTPANGDPTVGGVSTSRSIYWIVNDGNSVNGSNETQPTVAPVNNDQPSLGLNQLVVQNGSFPGLNGDPLTNGGGIPIGSIRTFAGNFAWGGTSEADGQTLAINSNTALFSLIGSSYGGNGTTDFQLPNLEARLAAGGASAGSAFGADDLTLTTPNLPQRWGGADTGFNNDQPSLTVQYLINTGGSFQAGQSTNVIGEVVPFVGATTNAPDGYMFANGQTLSIAQDPALFSIIGTTYGGNGTTTFALPDLNGRTIIGAGTDGVNSVTLGSTTGQDSTSLATANLPAPDGSGQPVNNDQPSLALTYLVALDGIFPSSGNAAPAAGQAEVGEIIAFAGTGTALDNMLSGGWAVANGQILSISQYQAQFAVLGNAYGGNGITTFALPDLVGRSVAGTGTNSNGTTVSLGESYGSNNFTLSSNQLPLPSVATSTLDIVHEPPVITAGATATIQSGAAPVTLDSTLTVSDPDSGGHLTGATVSIGSGFVAGDTLGFTNQNNITGSYNAATGVLTLNGTDTLTDYQAALDSVSFTTTTTTPGSRTIDWTANDGVASSTAATSTVNVVVGPTVTAVVGQPVNGGTIELQGTGEAGQTIDLYADGDTTTVVGTGTVGVGGTFDITTTATFPDGVHTFKATEPQIPTAVASTAFSVNVDPTAPVITAVVGQAVNGGAVELKGTGEVGETVKIFADGGNTVIGTGTVGVGGTFDVTTTATYADGVHSFTATETDAANLTSVASSPAFSINVDPTAPVITALVGQPVNSGPVELQGTGEVGETVKIFADGGNTVIGTGTVGVGGTFDITTTATYADGVHSFTATETDGANLTSTASSPAFSVNVDPTAPVITTLVGQPVNGGPVELQGTGEVGETVKIFADGGNTVVGSGTVGAGGSFDITTTAAYADGVHSFTATETDAANLTSVASSPAFSVNVYPTAPMITTKVGQPVNGGPVELQGTGEVGGTIKIFADGGNTVVGSGTVGLGGTFDITTMATYADGAHSFTATETDGANLTSTASSPAFSVNVDPTAPVITAAVGQSFNGDTVELTGTGEAGETIKLYADNNLATVVGTGTVGVGGTFDITTSATFAQGAHSFTATETDGANLTSTASTPAFPVTVDPGPDITAVVGQPLNGSTVELQGTGQAAAMVNLYVGGNLVGTGLVGVGGTFDITTSIPFADDAYHFTAKETNGVQTSAASPAFSVNVEAVAPTALTQVGTPTNGGSIEITGHTTDAAGDTITLYNGNAAIGTGLVQANGSFDVTATGPFADDTYSNITATDTSVDGSLTSAHSSAATAVVGVTAPTGLTQVGTPTNGGSIEIAGNTTDAVGDSITLYNGNTVIGTGLVQANGSFDVTAAGPFTDDTYSNITATDTSVDGSLTSAHSTAATAVVGVTAPTNLAQVGTPTNGGSIEITGHTTDAAGDTITLYNGNTVIGTGLVKANGSFDVTAAGPIPDGTYSVTSTDTSVDGTETSAASPAFSVNVDPIAPAITALVGQPLNGGPVEVRGTGEAGETINLYADGNATTIVGTGTVGAAGTFDILTTAAFAEGVHSFKATETDAAQLTSTASSPGFAVTVDPTAPVITTLVGQPQSGGPLEVRGTGEAGETIDLYADGNATTIIGTGTVGAGGGFDITTSVTFTQGPHTLTAMEIDAANLTSPASSPAFVANVGSLAPPPNTGQVGLPIPLSRSQSAVQAFSIPVTTLQGGPTPGLGFGNDGFTPHADVFVIRTDVNVNVADNGAINFDLPLQRLGAALDGDVVSVSATLADGRPLPAWLKFNGDNGQFAGLVPDDIATGSIGGDAGNPNRPHDPNVPAQLQQAITIEVVARDSRGNVAITQFTVDLVAQPQHRNDKHGWNRLPGGGLDRILDLVLVPDPLVRAADHAPWHHAPVFNAERISAARADGAAPAGRAGLSDQIRSHGWNAAATERLALLESLKQGLAPWP